MTVATTFDVWGQHEDNTLAQMQQVADTGRVLRAALMADGHFGYSQPIGGVVAYRGQISPSGVGYDIACGNKAVATNLTVEDVTPDLGKLADLIWRSLSFGMGRTNLTDDMDDHPLFDDPAWSIPQLNALKRKASTQLGTIGSGNHYVDLLADETGRIWIGVHFGSRGLGHSTAVGFLKLAHNLEWDARARGESMMDVPTLIEADSELGAAYVAAMELAGRYAYAGRDWVCQRVADLLGATIIEEVHNHHNFAWLEEHDGEQVWVVRKGATPAFPGQMGFIGGSMADESVIVRGVDTPQATQALHSTIHGAGRIMGRNQAAGKVIRKGPDKGKRMGGRITPEMMHNAVRHYGVLLKGAGTDESSFVYRKLAGVLEAHADAIEIVHRLRPLVVCMAGEDTFDPFKD